MTPVSSCINSHIHSVAKPIRPALGSTFASLLLRKALARQRLAGNLNLILTCLSNLTFYTDIPEGGKKGTIKKRAL